MTNANADWASQWPAWLTWAIRAIRDLFGWFSQHTVWGVPLDWPLRFVLIGGLYAALRRRLARRQAAIIAAGLLMAKEVFDIFAHHDLLSPRAPDWGDAADIASGLAGLIAAWLLEHMLRRHARRATLPHRATESSANNASPRAGTRTHEESKD